MQENQSQDNDKIQSEINQAHHFSLTLWLKQLLKSHYSTILQEKSQNSLQTLNQLKFFIGQKTQNLKDLILVKGKLEMLKNLKNIQNTSLETDKYQKIRANIKKQK